MVAKKAEYDGRSQAGNRARQTTKGCRLVGVLTNSELVMSTTAFYMYRDSNYVSTQFTNALGDV